MPDQPKAEDLRYASDKERRYALAFMRYLAGGQRREHKPPRTNKNYELTSERAEQIEGDVKQMVQDAASKLDA